MLRNMQSQGEHPERREKRYISVKDAAEDLNLSKLAVYRRYHLGVFPGMKAGRKISLYRPLIAALKAEIASCHPVDIDEFARAWVAAHTPAAPEVQVAS